MNNEKNKFIKKIIECFYKLEEKEEPEVKKAEPKEEMQNQIEMRFQEFKIYSIMDAAKKFKELPKDIILEGKYYDLILNILIINYSNPDYRVGYYKINDTNFSIIERDFHFSRKFKKYIEQQRKKGVLYYKKDKIWISIGNSLGYFKLLISEKIWVYWGKVINNKNENEYKACRNFLIKSNDINNCIERYL